MAFQPSSSNPFASSSLSANRPESIASASSQQSLHNDSYSHMSDTTLGDTSSTSSSPQRELVAPQTSNPTHQETPQAFSLPDLPLPFAPRIEADETIPFHAQKNYKHATWARTFHSRPELMIRPQSIEELQKVICLARKHRRRLVTVGSGHSPSDLTCTSSWMLSLDGLGKVLEVQSYSTPASTSTTTDSSTTTSEDGLGMHPLSTSDTHPNQRAQPPRYAGRALVQAGITLENLNLEMKKHGLTLPNLGSIHIQSLAGAIATATHGSSMRHGIISSSVRGLRIMLASGEARWCSARADQHPDLFRAALVSLGALGVITEIEIELAPARNIEWESSLWDLETALGQWHDTGSTGLWSSAEFVRCWWMPYTRRLVVWKADKTSKSPTKPQGSSSWLGFHAYQCALWVANTFPRLVPVIEYVVMGLAHGWTAGEKKGTGVEEQRTGLLMDCLYSQFVNEWALPFKHGPEAITRLDAWLRDMGDKGRIPISSKGVYPHAPIEVRVGNTGASERQGTEKHAEGIEGDPAKRNRAFLDPSCEDEPTLYLNATLYRPYGAAPPWKDRYYEAFEFVMKELGGRPHWAKNFLTVGRGNVEGMYGKRLQKWRSVRKEVDPEGLFCGDWHRRLVLEEEKGEEAGRMEFEEEEISTRDFWWQGGKFWRGRQAVQPEGVKAREELEATKALMRNVR